MQPQLMYSVRELTELLGFSYERRGFVRRLLQRSGVVLHYSKGPRSKGFVFLDELREKCPRLWGATLQAIEARTAA